jgi:hypothetical protein
MGEKRVSSVIGRRVPILVAVALGSVAVIASGGSSSGGSSSGGGGSSPSSTSSSGNETGGKVLQHSADVKIIKCKADQFGDVDAKVKITNHSSKASDYVITIAFESENGKVQIDTGDAFVDSLQPGQSSVQDAGGTKTYKKPYKCTLSDAERTASSL